MHVDVSGATTEQSQCRKCLSQPTKTLLEADRRIVPTVEADTRCGERTKGPESRDKLL